ncbi:hypothetical protein [Actinoplanes palleronii]|uniref:Secreted protein n=1 Tax=Actinoplanes palleronii TaxID=113570 RepID=A0ABQ4B7I5_9ACTN|nr:hypothetical protein [Actinoplanes palleronii]GIE66639.1 hypothetical protein Apa02nite_027470 [Actinoplanes palleronii]
MPGWRVERKPRTASRFVPDAPGSSPLMPPHSQGAERRTERRAGRTGSRWALRALVISGLAGAAWLLTGAAAHAAGTDSEPDSGFQLGTMSDDAEPATGNEYVVSELLKAAVQPLESVPETHRVLTFPTGSDGVPSETVDEDEPAIDVELFDEVRRPATAPLRTSGGDADDQERAEPGSDTADAVPVMVVPAGVPKALVADAVTERTAAELPEHPAASGTGGAAARSSIRVSRAPAGHSPARRAKAHSRSHVHRHAPAARPVASVAIRETVPDGDGPAPARMNLGAVSGVPAGGPGASTESGSSAVLPGGIVNGPVACHRCPVAPDVDARRHDAEAPTVSPD